jgi:polysaccharide biosynthesis protein PslG
MSFGFCCSEAIDLAVADQVKVMVGIAHAGATFVRIDVPWSVIETSPGVYNYTPLAPAVNAALGAGLKPILVLNGPKPQTGFWFWAADATWATPGEYGNFVSAVVKQFPQVTDYELWNEPNLLSFFNPVNPVAFAPYLQAGYTAGKKTNPNATFALGGLAATVDYTGFVWSLTPLLFGIFQVTAQPSHYLAGLYAAGCKGFLDAVAYHPYVGNPSTSTPEEPVVGNPSFQEFANLFAVMAANGNGTLEIWPTEWGFSTAQMSDAQQAAWLVEQATNMNNIPQLSHSCLFTYRDWTAPSTVADNNFGVIDFDYTPKPALAALRGVLK